jgi:hypothetical protein
VTDVAVQTTLTAQLPVDDERHAKGLDIDQVPVFVPALHDGMLRFAVQHLPCQGIRSLRCARHSSSL